MAEHELRPEDREVIARLRALQPEDAITSVPPIEVWDAISEELGLARPATQPSRRRFNRRVVLAVAGAAAAAVIATTVVVSVRDSDGSDLLAEATLSSQGLPSAPPGLSGHAVVRNERGEEVLHVDATGVQPRSGQFLEVWLIERGITGMVSLGAARPDGNYVLPAGLRIGEYPIVDVSSEPYDGNPTHSGDSLLRGTLT